MGPCYKSAVWSWMSQEQLLGEGNPATTVSATVAPASCYLLFCPPVLMPTYFQCLLGCVGPLAAYLCIIPCQSPVCVGALV